MDLNNNTLIKMQNIVELVKVGSDGTVKLPEDAIKKAGFKAGSTVLILSSDKGVMLGKANKKFFDATSRMHARKKKISEDEVEDLIQKVRYPKTS